MAGNLIYKFHWCCGVITSVLDTSIGLRAKTYQDQFQAPYVIQLQPVYAHWKVYHRQRADIASKI